MNGRLTRNTAILLANNVISAGLAFLITVIIGHGLGVTGLGRYSFVMASIAPIIAIADLGMGTLMTRDVARDRLLAVPLLKTTLRLLWPVAGILLALTWLAVPLLGLTPEVAIAFTLIASLIVLDPWYGLYTALFRALQRMTPIFAVNIAGLVVQLLLSVVAIASGFGLIGIAVVVVIVNLGQLIATRLWWQQVASDDTRVIQIPPFRAIVHRAFPFALAALLSTLQLRLNVLLLEHWAGDASVGLYAAASRFVEAGRLVPSAYFGALFPVLAGLAFQKAALRRTFRRAAALITVYALIFALTMTGLGSVLISLTFGAARDSFGGAIPVLTTLSWTLIPSLLHSILTLYHYSLGREGFVNIVTGVALLGQILVGWFLISRQGAIGAALTVGIVETGSALFLAIGLGLPVRSRA